MKTKSIFLSIMTIFLIAASIAKAGPGSSGGGQAVKLPDGTYRFLDMLSDSELEQVVEIKADELKSERCVKKPIYKKDDFKMNLERVNANLSRYPQLKHFLKMATEFIKNKVYFSDVHELFVTRDSQRISQSKQINIGVFTGSALLVYEPIYTKLSEADREAFWVHESLRQYVYAFGNQDKISLEDIEKATPAIINSESLDSLWDILDLQPIEMKIGSILQNLQKVKNLVETQLVEDSAENDRSILAKLIAAGNLLEDMKQTRNFATGIYDKRVHDLIRSIRLNVLRYFSKYEYKVKLEPTVNTQLRQDILTQLADLLHSSGLLVLTYDVFNLQSVDQAVRLDYDSITLSTTNAMIQDGSDYVFDTKKMEWISGTKKTFTCNTSNMKFGPK